MVFLFVFSITIPRLHPMDEHTLQQQRHCGDTIEHMTIAGLVHHRSNVIENVGVTHRGEQMVIQQPRMQDMTVITDFRPKDEKYN